MRPFGATNKPNTCLWCGKKLVFEYKTEWEQTNRKPRECGRYITSGYYDVERCGDRDISWDEKENVWRCSKGHVVNFIRRAISREKRSDKPGHHGLFCTLSCGYLFGVALAQQGRRLEPKKE